jgi:glucan phosphoethanolaminetransferase (alkaline phosphatase superfamily)
MKKSTINFIINVLMFICMSAITGVGLLIKYTLISGQERWIVYGGNVELYLFGMDRHEWGYIHLIIGFVLLGLLVLHIILHLNIIKSIYNRIFKRKLIYKLITVLFFIICALLIIVPFLAKPNVSRIEQGVGRQTTNDNHTKRNKNTNENNHTKKNRNTNEKENNTKAIEIHKHSTQVIEIRGYMTLDEISKKYKVPTEYIKTKLNIPKSVVDKQRLGLLRRKYDIEMSSIEKIIREYQEKNE